ncbi:alcohol dehydrogenase groES-like domain-containing protein [Ditylenchus destructor]|uniref:Alcohol dehydrogenase groES-like domain-containing protein n=1 Tax=Ditylenchus destructor TaxID=166010 RepID=A0AAD4R444_9BILA|nr:alcohol dehydrogenase groES-like domain-containing protein [Ditylenchus destructor]
MDPIYSQLFFTTLTKRLQAMYKLCTITNYILNYIISGEMHSKRALKVFSAHLKQMSRDFTQAMPGSLGEAAIPKTVAVEGMMDAWVTEVFKTPPARRQIEVPRISRPDQVLVKVKASSINPLDPQMTNGYGNELLSNWAQLENNSWNPLTFFTSQKSDRLPIITGRDFSGEIVQVGSKVRDYLPGDEIIGVVPAHWQGSHAEYCLAPLHGIARKPISVGHVEACAYAYTACTAWSALVTIARINKNNAHNTRVLIHGGSGGVGSTAIQLLKAWGVPKIVATCSAKNSQSIEKLGAKAVDYNSPSAKDEIIAEGPYEMILDCVDSELSRVSMPLIPKLRSVLVMGLLLYNFLSFCQFIWPETDTIVPNAKIDLSSESEGSK